MLVARLFFIARHRCRSGWHQHDVSYWTRARVVGLHRNVCADRNLLLLSRVCREENIDRCGIRCLGRVGYLVDHRGVDHRL